MIPKLDGMEVMNAIREKSTVPIIIVSAKDTDSDKSLGLGLGADDYVTKPFSVTEVLARIKANIRRTTQYSAGIERREDTITWGKLTINTEDYSVLKEGERIELTVKEFEILKLLVKNPKKGLYQKNRFIPAYGMMPMWEMKMQSMSISADCGTK